VIIFILPFSIYIPQAHAKSERRSPLGSKIKCYVWLNVSSFFFRYL